MVISCANRGLCIHQLKIMRMMTDGRNQPLLLSGTPDMMMDMDMDMDVDMDMNEQHTPPVTCGAGENENENEGLDVVTVWSQGVLRVKSVSKEKPSKL